VPLQKYPAAQSLADVAQLVLQDEPPHWYAPQLEVAGVEQLPRPSQYAVDVSVPPVHEAAEHTVDVPGGVPHATRFEPLHVALQTPVPVHAGRAPTGAPETGVHVPTLPATLHASH
jgi:hypothetical protein